MAGTEVAAAVAALDWAQPWYEPWRSSGLAVATRVHSGASVAQALNVVAPQPGFFIPQHQLPAGEPYERFIFERGACPTRENLHDFFNGLVWLRLPRTKRQLNRLQAEQIGTAGVGGRRGPVRDAITVFDENGAVLAAPDALWQALLARDWQRLFTDLRPLWADARLLIVGHALLEKLAAPRKDMTAHVWCEPAPSTDPAGLDAWLSQRCSAQRLASKPFTPLPVLGIPGWCPDNGSRSFYEDPRVFRRRAGS